MPHSDKVCCPTDQGPAKGEYKPTGSDFYITGPIGAKAGVLFVGDIFGPLPNSKRFVDALGEQGYLVVYPDFFGSGAWDEHAFPPNFESDEWKAFYALITDNEKHAPLARRGIEILRSLGCTKVGTMGACWGARLALLMGEEGLADAVATAHPSFLTGDVVDEVKNVPVMVLPSKDEGNMEEVEAAVNRNPNTHVFKTYDQLPHGYFANRNKGESWGANERAQFEDAMATTLSFYKKTLA